MLLGIETIVIPQLFLKILEPLRNTGVIPMTPLLIGGRGRRMYNQEIFLAEKFLRMLSQWGTCQYYYKTDEISDQCMGNVIKLLSKYPHLDIQILEEGDYKIFFGKVK